MVLVQSYATCRRTVEKEAILPLHMAGSEITFTGEMYKTIEYVCQQRNSNLKASQFQM
jgi:hypothetical protein